MYYNYHSRIRQRIEKGELIDHYWTLCYPRIGEALVLVFKTEPFKRPIRPHSYERYPEFCEKNVNDWG